MARGDPGPAVADHLETGARDGLEPRRNTSGAAKRPSRSRLPSNGRQRAPGMCPATGSIGSTSPRKRASARASTRSIESPRSSRSAQERRASMHREPETRRRADAPREAQWISFGLPGRQAAVQHRDTGMAEPAEQPPGPCRVRAIAGVVRDTWVCLSTPQSPNVSASTVGSGNGCRPVMRGINGPERSVARSANIAPGTWPAA